MDDEVFERAALRSLDDFEWLLVPNGSTDLAEQLDRGDPALLKAAAARVQQEKSLLFLFHGDGTPPLIERLSLFVPESSAPLLLGLVESRWEHAVRQSSASRVLPGSGILWCDVQFGDDATEEARNDVVSRIFSRFLVSGRPLRHYSCTFFLPLDLRLDGELEHQSELPACLRVPEDRTVERYRVKVPRALLEEHGDSDKIPRQDSAHAQAYEFFYTHLQKQLFETESTATIDTSPDHDRAVVPIIHRRLSNAILSGLTLDLIETRKNPDGVEEASGAISGAVEDVSLYEYYNGLFLLGIRVGMPGSTYLMDLMHKAWNAPDAQNALVREDKDWWHGLVFTTDKQFEESRKRQVEDWLRYTKTSRVLFASFREQGVERKIARQKLRKGDQVLAERHINDQFSSVALHFLGHFFTKLPREELSRDQRLGQVADDRMFVHVAYSLSGPPPCPDTPEIAEFERLFSYALYVDQHSDGAFTPDGWACDQQYTKGLMKKDVLYRWYGVGNLSGFTNASSVFMGFGGFSHTPVASVHVPYVYAKIQILVLFFRMTLELFDRRIGAATQRLVEESHRTAPFRDLRQNFIEFTNNYWFRHLTPQVQGEEIASRMMVVQDLEGVYELIKDEMERADEYARAIRDHWFQKRADKAGWIAGGLAIAAIFLTFVEDIFRGPALGAFSALIVIASIVWTIFFATRKFDKPWRIENDDPHQKPSFHPRRPS